MHYVSGESRKRKADMDRTNHWARRSLAAFQKKGKFEQMLYGIVQGSIFKDFRQESAQYIASHPFDGIAIGGVSVGESKKEMLKVIDWVVPALPEEKIRHVLGIGDIDDIFELIARGIDTFDCVMPSRLGRTGHIFTSPPEGNRRNRFRLDITKSIYAQSTDPLDRMCMCYVCTHFTRAYLQHLFRAEELLAYHLATYHNIFFITSLVKRMRNSLLNDSFSELRKNWLE